MVSRLRDLDLLNNKHIPIEYLRASREQRVWLLAGLMDTDGSLDADGSSAVFTSMNEGLAREVLELLVSLGVRGSFRKKEVYSGTSYMVEFFPFEGCVTLPRKVERIRVASRGSNNRLSQRTITNVEKTGKRAQFTCISVDAPDRLFLAGRSMIPTHNSWAIAAALVLDSARKPMRIACVRENQNSIEQSAKAVITGWIHRLGMTDQFIISKNTIDHKITGSHFFFKGLNQVTEDAVRGWENISRCWVEEAHRISQSSREVLYPTIFRNDSAEIWMSFNPKNRNDPVFLDFVSEKRRAKNAWIRKVNYNDNPFFPEVAEIERQETLDNEPSRYAHIWLGETDDEGDAQKVLPYTLADLCRKAWKEHYGTFDVRGTLHVGLDVAESGADKNALVARRGPLLTHVEQWTKRTLGQTARKADSYCRREGATVMYYDRGGIGAGIRSHLIDMGSRPYAPRGINFGSAVMGEKVEYTRGATNADFFNRRNAQLAWALRLRAQKTEKLMKGEVVNKDHCLFINAEMPNVEALLTQLAQPEYEENMSGRLVVKKTPDNLPSPDMFDATCLAFGNDSRFGLRIKSDRSLMVGQQRISGWY